jgi:exopolyphosphatase/guanosine-5'-triphosphate,3'-diphosphate pyrophosphatase
MKSPTRVAALDIGTNTILMLVAEGPPVRVLVDRAHIVRLGQGVDRTGRLDDAAIQRGLGVLREYADCARTLGATPCAVGTQALREVANAEAFLRPAREILGCDVEIIDGLREAELAWGAVREAFPDLSDAVVMDVGGGSTELVLAEAGAVIRKTSLRIGSVRLHERFLAHDPPLAEELAAAGQAVDEAVAPWRAELPRRLPVVGVAGTVTSLLALRDAVDPYDAARVHGQRLSRDDVTAQIDRLARMPLAALRTLPGLDPRRADVILAGAIIVARLLDALGAAELRVSDHGVRWGLLHERLAASATAPRGEIA